MTNQAHRWTLFGTNTVTEVSGCGKSGSIDPFMLRWWEVILRLWLSIILKSRKPRIFTALLISFHWILQRFIYFGRPLPIVSCHNVESISGWTSINGFYSDIWIINISGIMKAVNEMIRIWSWVTIVRFKVEHWPALYQPKMNDQNDWFCQWPIA